MQFEEAKQKFIRSWGDLGINWGINKSMGQIHALLLVETEALNSDQIMDALDISRGSASMNLHALKEWELIFRQSRIGDRKDYYYAEKDIWKVFQGIIRMRKSKELDPLLDLIDALSTISDKTDKSQEFLRIMKDIKAFSYSTDKALENLANYKSNFVLNNYLSFLM